MHFVWEIVLAAVALIVSFGMLRHPPQRFNRWHAMWQENDVLAYVSYLFAWLPVWFIARFFWELATGHETYHYPWWFPWLFWLGVVLAVFGAISRFPLLVVVRVIGFILVITALWNLGWFWPASFRLNVDWPWYVWLLLVVAVALLIVGLVRRSALAVVVSIVIFALVAGGSLLNNLSNNIQANLHGNVPSASSSSPTSVPSQSPTSSPSPTPKPSPTKACADTWKLKTADHGSNRWFADGVTTIQNAKTSAQARAAANDWVHKVEYDPALLSGAIKYFLNKDVPAAQLTAGKCASVKAKTLASELELKLATSKITAGNAPSNGTNSGVDNGRVVSATTSGITGNTKAIKVVLKDGTVVWIMARCGNPVTVGKAPVPPGKTERQPKPPVVHRPPAHPVSKCVPSQMPPRAGFKVNSRCQYYKPPQTRNCMLNNIGCPVPNQATQPVQHNPGQPVGTSTGAPASPPPPAPSSTTAPGGSSGTSTSTPTGTPTCDPANGCGSTHTDPPPTGIG